MNKNLDVIGKTDLEEISRTQLSGVVEPVVSFIGDCFAKMEKDSQIQGHLEIETGNIECNYEKKTLTVSPYKLKMSFYTMTNNNEKVDNE